jgi:hypothetical protein
MINRPKENDMKDLDQSDVNRDAETMYQTELDELGDRLDGADLFSIIQILRDWDDSLTLESSVIRDMIQFTQSNPAQALTTLKRMIELDDAISSL